MDAQMEAVYETLDRLGIAGKPVITLFNKRDLAADSELPKGCECGAYPSAFPPEPGRALKNFWRSWRSSFGTSRVQVEKLFPYAQAGDIQRIRKIGQVLEEEYREDGIFIRAWMPAQLLRDGNSLAVAIRKKLLYNFLKWVCDRYASPQGN